VGKSIQVSEPRGYFGICLWMPKYEVNVGSIMRSAAVLGAKFVLIVGHRYRRQRSDTLFAEHKIPFFHAEDEADFWRLVPQDCALVALELAPEAKPLPSFDHPVNALYIFGAEDGAVPDAVQAKAQTIQIPGTGCLNLATAAAILMYDRTAKRARLYRRQRIEAA